MENMNTILFYISGFFYVGYFTIQRYHKEILEGGVVGLILSSLQIVLFGISSIKSDLVYIVNYVIATIFLCTCVYSITYLCTEKYKKHVLAQVYIKYTDFIMYAVIFFVFLMKLKPDNH